MYRDRAAVDKIGKISVDRVGRAQQPLLLQQHDRCGGKLLRHRRNAKTRVRRHGCVRFAVGVSDRRLCQHLAVLGDHHHALKAALTDDRVCDRLQGACLGWRLCGRFGGGLRLLRRFAAGSQAAQQNSCQQQRCDSFHGQHSLKKTKREVKSPLSHKYSITNYPIFVKVPIGTFGGCAVGHFRRLCRWALSAALDSWMVR